MFYTTDQPHGLPHNPFNALIVPRPIGWISSIDATGHVNLAPYSFFNGVAYNPPQIMFSATGPRPMGGFKDTVKNVQEIGEFVVNLATYALREEMNASSAPAPARVDEFSLAGLTPVASKLVKPPRVAESPAHLECRYLKSVALPSADKNTPNTVIFGEVIAVHIDDKILTGGLVDYRLMQPLARLGYMDYAEVSSVFEMHRPDYP